jgi:myosin heavy subunit
MKHFTLLDIALNLFDGGAASGGEGTGAAAPTGQSAEGAQKAGTQAPGSSRRDKSGGLNNVVYGKQAGAEAQGGEAGTAGQEGSDAGSKENKLTPEEKRAKFRELVDTEYKDEYAQEFQTAFDRRFKEAREMQERMQRTQPILDSLMAKYKIEDGDISKLNEAIEKDDAYWSAAAEEAGMTVEQYKQFQKLQRENVSFRNAQRQSQSRQAAQQQLLKWQSEGEGVKSDYPDFDFATEAKNPQFLSMLKAGVPVKHAYEVAHLDDIKGTVAKTTAQQTEKKVVDGIRAKGSRPTENGVSSQSGVIYKPDVSKLTKKDRAEIPRRAARGEEITF